MSKTQITLTDEQRWDLEDLLQALAQHPKLIKFQRATINLVRDQIDQAVCMGGDQ